MNTLYSHIYKQLPRIKIAGILLLLIAVTACGKNEPATAEGKAPAATASKPAAGAHEAGGLKLSAEDQQRAGITLETVKPQPWVDSLTVTASIHPNAERMARVAPRVEGRVVAVAVKLGDRVRAGQALATLDSPVLGEASSAWLQAQSNLRIAEADYQRAAKLHADEIIAQKDFLRAQSEREKAAAAARAAQDRLRLLGVQPGSGSGVQARFPVTAPIAGIVVEKKAALGELATPNEPLFVVADLSTVWIEANLAESQLAQVRPGARAAVQVNAYPGERFAGRVTYVGALLDKVTRTVPARIELPNPDGRLKPEMFATVMLESPAPQVKGQAAAEAITVPDAAVVLLQGQPTVFVAEHGGFEPRAVETGAGQQGRTRIRSGLAAGEQVVASGAYALKARLLKSQIGDEH